MRLRLTMTTLAGYLFLAAVAGQAQAEFEINQRPNLWKLPSPEEAEKDEKPPPPPTYSGDPVRLPAACASLDEGICTASRPCPLSLELLGVAEIGERLIVFGDQRTTESNAASVLFASDDRGLTWVRAAEPVAGAALERAAFPDAEHGFIAAYEDQGGVALQPFLLVTADGGMSWRRWDVSPGAGGRFGSIVDMRFDSPKHGQVVVERSAAVGDRFERYETFNAGRSWSIRQLSSDRPRIPGGLRMVEEPAWRVAHGPNEWRIENRVGDDWALVARFAEALGHCGGEAEASSRQRQIDDPLRLRAVERTRLQSETLEYKRESLRSLIEHLTACGGSPVGRTRGSYGRSARS